MKSCKRILKPANAIFFPQTTFQNLQTLFKTRKRYFFSANNFPKHANAKRNPANAF
jgi:hypothetical protein